MYLFLFFFFFQAEDGIRDGRVTGVQTCALPILLRVRSPRRPACAPVLRCAPLHPARRSACAWTCLRPPWRHAGGRDRKHTSELQSPVHLVCRLLLEKKKKKANY